jgi:spermidine synthase
VSSFAISTVLAAYMGGLALGSWWVGTRTARMDDSRRVYAFLEIGIGVYALAIPYLLLLAEPLYGELWRRFHLSFGVFTVLRFLLAGSILLVPTALMGATLPVLADDLVRRAGRTLTPPALYALNLAGAVVGVATAGFILLPNVGVWGTIVTAAIVNISVGGMVLALPPTPPRDEATDETTATEPPSRGRGRRREVAIEVVRRSPGCSRWPRSSRAWCRSRPRWRGRASSR